MSFFAAELRDLSDCCMTTNDAFFSSSSFFFYYDHSFSSSFPVSSRAFAHTCGRVESIIRNKSQTCTSVMLASECWGIKLLGTAIYHMFPSNDTESKHTIKLVKSTLNRLIRDTILMAGISWAIMSLWHARQRWVSMSWYWSAYFFYYHHFGCTLYHCLLLKLAHLGGFATIFCQNRDGRNHAQY